MEIVSRKRLTWRKVIEDHFREEGFDSPADMDNWCHKERLLKGGRYWIRKVYFHKFTIQRIFKEKPA